MIAGLAHTADAFGQSIIPPGVQPQLDLIRDTKLEVIKAWLGVDEVEYKVNTTTPSSFASAPPNPVLGQLERRRHGGDRNCTNDGDTCNDDGDHNEKAKKIAIIVGSVVGGLLLIVAVVFWIWFCVCLNKTRKAHRKHKIVAGRSGAGSAAGARGWMRVGDEDGGEIGSHEERLIPNRDDQFPGYEAYRGQA